jgi:hypothetical protein
MAAVAMSAHGVAFKQGMSLGKSEFAGRVVKQSASSSAAAAAVPASTFVSVRASGYDEELVKTAVRVSIFLSSSSAFHVFVFHVIPLFWFNSILRSFFCLEFSPSGGKSHTQTHRLRSLPFSVCHCGSDVVQVDHWIPLSFCLCL